MVNNNSNKNSKRGEGQGASLFGADLAAGKLQQQTATKWQALKDTGECVGECVRP